jgi:hypothetical protein
MPPPATSRALHRSGVSAADGHRPRAVPGSVEPADGAAVPPALEPLHAGDELERLVAWVAAERGGRRELADEVEHVRCRRRQASLDGAAEVLHVGDRHDRRLGLPVEVADPGQQRVVHDLDDDPVLHLVLRARDEVGRETGVGVRVAGPRRRAGERV